MAVLKKLQYHDFIAKVQSNFILNIKSNLGSNEYLVIADFTPVSFKMLCNHTTGMQLL